MTQNNTEYTRLESRIVAILDANGPKRISEVGEILDEDHWQVRRAMSNLADRKLVAGRPDFCYEFVGPQERLEP